MIPNPGRAASLIEQGLMEIDDLSWFAFWMIGAIARNVRTILEARADEIAALWRQLEEQRPAA